MKKLILAILLSAGVAVFAEDVFVGEYKGSCEAPKGSYFQMNPTVHMQISRITPDTYRVKKNDGKVVHSGNFPKEVSLVEYEAKTPSDHFPVQVRLSYGKKGKR